MAGRAEEGASGEACGGGRRWQCAEERPTEATSRAAEDSPSDLTPRTSLEPRDLTACLRLIDMETPPPLSLCQLHR
ncbi:hypothetical protein GUJ93_ZPchr0014g47679 [Zizania palustris]|uniref:Uncharacterized protein n=1 Tax=Zizania palustris TaxID=103762 RepID=A0A8J5TFM4_ZIZPA|nr:hypothetical protein GUJ93_ZPchr0014g47679 [Zizania palustris]